MVDLSYGKFTEVVKILQQYFEKPFHATFINNKYLLLGAESEGFNIGFIIDDFNIFNNIDSQTKYFEFVQEMQYNKQMFFYTNNDNIFKLVMDLDNSNGVK